MMSIKDRLPRACAGEGNMNNTHLYSKQHFHNKHNEIKKSLGPSSSYNQFSTELANVLNHGVNIIANFVIANFVM